MPMMQVVDVPRPVNAINAGIAPYIRQDDTLRLLLL